MFAKCLHATLLGSLGVLIGCATPGPHAVAPSDDPMLSVNTLHPAPDDFAESRIGSAEFPIPAYAKFLDGVRICIDPGHGGDAHKRGYKRGPTGVREAEMNLRVAKYLWAFLEAAGAEVRLTREEDVDLSLAERAAVANDWGADLFFSLHHNAVDNRPHVNYTTVWYHNDVDWRPANLDLARYLCNGLYDALAVPQLAEVPLKSDQLMYPDGFGVLRAAEVTAALTEASFFSNPEEEQRLRDPSYNLVEAHGLFIGLARYALAGLPRAHLIQPADGIVRDPRDATLVFALDDGLRGRQAWGHERQMILSDTIGVRIDGAKVPFDFVDEGESYTLTVPLPASLPPGVHDVAVHFHNMNKNAVLNPHFELVVGDGRP
jgi:N-acetylmuramoyl-L-alanine amidase